MLLGQILYKISMDTASFQAGLATAAAGLKSIASRSAEIGRSLTMGLTLPLAAVGGVALKMSTDFNAAMANVATLIPGNIDRVQELKKNVQDMAIATAKGTKDIAEGAYQVISAFGDSADTAKILETNVRGAAAGLSTVTDALNLTSAVTKAYGNVSAEAVQKASDLAFITVKLGQTTFPELAASIGSVTPMAAKLKMVQEELFAGFATLTGVTGSAAEVSTQMAAILRAMIKPTDEMSTAVRKLGYNSAESMVQELGMVGALRELIGTTDGSTESVAKLFGRAESLTAVFALTGAQAAVFDEKLKQLYNSAGATDLAFREQTEGINKAGFTMAQAKQEAIVLAQQFGDVLAPAISDVIGMVRPMVDWLKKGIEWFAGLDEGTRKVILGVIGVTMAIGPALLAFSKIISVISTATTIFGAISNPIGLAVVAIGGLITIGIALYKNWDIVAERIAKAINWIIEGINKVTGLRIPTINILGARVEVPEIPKYQHGTAYVPETGLAMVHKGEAIIPATENKKSLGETIKSAFGFQAGAGKSIGEALKSAIGYQAGAGQSIGEALKSAIGYQAGARKSIGEEVKKELTSTWAGITNVYKDVADRINKEVVEHLKLAWKIKDAVGVQIKAADLDEQYKISMQNIVNNVIGGSKEVEKNMVSMNDTISNNIAAVAKTVESTLPPAFGTTAKVVESTELDISEAMKKLTDEVKQRTASFMDFGRMFERVTVERFSPAKILNRLRRTFEQMQQWSQGLTMLQVQGVSGDVLQGLRMMGPEAAGLVKGFTKMSPEQLEQAMRYMTGTKARTEEQAVQTVKFEHTGTIRVEGVNSYGELVGVAKILAEEMAADGDRYATIPGAAKSFK